jgi:hypothetical protein
MFKSRGVRVCIPMYTLTSNIFMEEFPCPTKKVSHTPIFCQFRQGGLIHQFVVCLSVTPYFPQFVKITGLAKNCGKLRNVNM